jgi:hypothetical protein
MGRREASGITDRKTGEVRRPGKITREMMHAKISAAKSNCAVLESTSLLTAISDSTRFLLLTGIA